MTPRITSVRVVFVSMLVFITLLCFEVRLISSNLFAKVCKGCNASYFETFHSESLSHCTMKCTQRHQCSSVSFGQTTNICKLYTLPATDCTGVVQSGVITMQRKENRSECPATLIHDQLIGLEDLCDQSFVDSPIVFKIKGSDPFIGSTDGDFIDFILHNGSLGMGQVKVGLQEQSNIEYVSLWVTGAGSAVFWIGDIIDKDLWYSYWITYSRQETGNTTVSIGKGELIGCDMMKERSDILDFRIEKAFLYSDPVEYMNVSLVFYDYY